ncbi:MAG: dimethyl sulfoxide reductase anchor subunit [Rhodobacteraceae bacterium]|nr:dimethyl sulfoxide reductase anchor subunit [Alphaproteobacteria bacterium]NNK65835.1 dimethyl sulfoxide reductase anchor subunit [Paracoccaceae bacterium]
MHPAPSLIAFTTLSGLGFGLMAWLGLGFPDVTGWVAFVFYLIAFALAGVGLLASTLHLGHPERALKAFTQWRSSWLSREAWLAVATMIVTGLYALGLVFADTRIAPLGWLSTALALVTVYATSMIYAQLKTVPRWNHWSTPLIFVAHAVAGGAILSGQVQLGAFLVLLLGLGQLWTWQTGDTRLAASGTSMGTATGLGDRGAVRAFEPPHTGTNYLLTEMVHVVARRHANKLRLIAFGLMTALPWIILFLLPFHHILAGLAVISHIAGALIGRWLFFAQAEHVVGFYYGKR